MKSERSSDNGYMYQHESEKPEKINWRCAQNKNKFIGRVYITNSEKVK